MPNNTDNQETTLDLPNFFQNIDNETMDSYEEMDENYMLNEVSTLTSAQMNQLQLQKDMARQEFISEMANAVPCSAQEIVELKTAFSNTMETTRTICMDLETALGHPKAIYNMNLKSGNVETNKNGKRIRYSTAGVAPCTTSVWRFLVDSCGEVDVIVAPIKSIKRTFEKILSERIKEHKELSTKKLTELNQVSEQEEQSFFDTFSLLDDHCPTIIELAKLYQNETKNHKQKNKMQKAFDDINKDSLIPRDIFRLSVLVKFPEQIGIIARRLEKNFKNITFTERDDDRYRLPLSENERLYFDRKKTGMTIMTGNIPIYIEFQFKQKNMFYAHIRSHIAYEEYRELMATYNKTQDPADKKKALAAKRRCFEIHKNAVHQSNLYLLDHISWLDDNNIGFQKNPFKSNGQFLESITMLEKNYIVSSYNPPFDGVKAFATSNDEYLNKACYLKLIGLLPESFDELGKRAKIEINKAWHNMTPTDIENFNRITATAIKYQDVIRRIQQEKQAEDIKAHPTPIVGTFPSKAR